LDLAAKCAIGRASIRRNGATHPASDYGSDRFGDHRTRRSLTIMIVKGEPAPVLSAARRLATVVYDAQADSRTPILDGPWWIGITAAAALSVLAFGAAPWKWLALPFVAVLLWLPLVARWLVALWKMGRAVREASRS